MNEKQFQVKIRLFDTPLENRTFHSLTGREDAESHIKKHSAGYFYFSDIRQI